MSPSFVVSVTELFAETVSCSVCPCFSLSYFLTFLPPCLVVCFLFLLVWCFGASHKQPLERKRRTAGGRTMTALETGDGRYDSEPDDDTMLTAEEYAAENFIVWATDKLFHTTATLRLSVRS